MAKKKTWTDKLTQGRPPEVVVLEKAFAGVPAGAKLFIASPTLIRDYVAGVPVGTTRAVPQMRADFAAANGADATCPTTTSIFLRIVAEAALEEVAAGKPVALVTPFWRVVDPESPLAGKLSCGPDFIRTQRALEARAAAA